MIRPMAPERFDRVYRLMEESFPKDEYRPYPAQKALLEEPGYRLWIMEEKEELLGFCAVWELEGCLFLEHLAVEPRYRNRGLGARFLRELAQHYRMPLCLEVELPESDLARRRIGFYERNGFVLNRYPYEMPALAPGQSPVPLLLMTSPHPLSPEEFPRVRDALYRQVYHQ